MTVLDTPESAIAAYVHRLVGRPVEPQEPIISSQLLESIAAVQLIDFVERSFAVLIDDEDLVLANFDSVNAIVALVRTKCGVR
jgi:acyl carrier protein